MELNLEFDEENISQYIVDNDYLEFADDDIFEYIPEIAKAGSATGLTIFNCGNLSGKIEPLSNLTQLTSLILDGSELVNDDLFPFTKLTDLKNLSLNGNDIDEELFKNWDLKKLQTLELEPTILKDLQIIANAAPNLKKLSITGESSECEADGCLKTIAINFNHLNNLCLIDLNIVDYSPLIFLPALKKLELFDRNFNAKIFPVLPNISELRISSHIWGLMLPSLFEFKNIFSLAIIFSNEEPMNLLPLLQIPSLYDFFLAGNYLNTDLKVICQLKNLKYLDFSRLINMNDSIFETLNHLNVKFLNVNASKCSISNEKIEIFAIQHPQCKISCNTVKTNIILE